MGPKARGQSRQIQSKVLQEPKAEASVLLLYCRNLSFISRQKIHGAVVAVKGAVVVSGSK